MKNKTEKKSGRGVPDVSPEPLMEALCCSECPCEIRDLLYGEFIKEFKNQNAMVGGKILTTRKAAFEYLCFAIPNLSPSDFIMPEGGSTIDLAKNICEKYFFAPSKSKVSIFTWVYRAGDDGSYLTVNPYDIYSSYDLEAVQQWMRDSDLDSDCPSCILEKTDPGMVNLLLRRFRDSHQIDYDGTSQDSFD